MSERRVTLTLTLAQARALLHAAGNSMEADDAVEALFATGSERACAYRAFRKLEDAVYGRST